ncbi:MAG TPA: trigger factor [Phycisphaerae bacterium]
MADEEVGIDEEPETAGAAEPEHEHEHAEAELPEEKKLIAKLKESITVEQQDIGTLRKKLTITVPRDAIGERLHEQFSELRRDALVPGFRKGRAPLRLVEKRFGSEVGDQLITQLVTNSYIAATEKHDLKPLGDPLFWVKLFEERTLEDGKITRVEAEKLVDIEKALEHMKLPHDGPLVYSCEVDLRPQFELPNLENIPVNKPKVTITDQDVDSETKRLLAMRAQLVPVEEGPIQSDDAVIVDLKAVCEGAIVKEESNALLAARGQLYAGIPLPNFGEAVVGKRPGDSVTLTATIPDDYENIDQRGKPAEFEFTIREFKRFKLPELDQELLGSLGFENEQELRDVIRHDLDSKLDQAVRSGMRNQVAKYLIENTKLDIPSGVSQRQAERLVQRRTIEMYQLGLPQPEIDKRMDELRGQAAEQAVKELKLFFILERIAEDREVEVTEDELNGAIAQIAARRNRRFDRMRDELSKGGGLQMLYLQLRDNKIMDELLEIAQITETAGPSESSPAEPESAPTE